MTKHEKRKKVAVLIAATLSQRTYSNVPVSPWVTAYQNKLLNDKSMLQRKVVLSNTKF